MRPSATNVGLTAYVQNDSGEYTPQPFEMMSESQMVVFEHHIVGISVAVRATLTRTRAQTRSTCHVSRATLMPSPVCARHQMILKKKPGRRPYSMSAFTFKVIYVVTSASHPKCFWFQEKSELSQGALDVWAGLSIIEFPVPYLMSLDTLKDYALYTRSPSTTPARSARSTSAITRSPSSPGLRSMLTPRTTRATS